MILHEYKQLSSTSHLLSRLSLLSCLSPVEFKNENFWFSSWYVASPTFASRSSRIKSRRLWSSPPEKPFPAYTHTVLPRAILVFSNRTINAKRIKNATGSNVIIFECLWKAIVALLDDFSGGTSFPVSRFGKIHTSQNPPIIIVWQGSSVPSRFVHLHNWPIVGGIYTAINSSPTWMGRFAIPICIQDVLALFGFILVIHQNYPNYYV